MLYVKVDWQRGDTMADVRYNVEHDITLNELSQIKKLLNELSDGETCTIVIDGVNQHNAESVFDVIDPDRFTFYTKGIGTNETQIIVKSKA
jgi:hypothetical protein